MRGFTLVELLVVVLIIGLIISIAGVNVGGNEHRQLHLDAKDFANNTGLMMQEAALSNRQWGVDLYRDYRDGEAFYGYRWLILSRDGEWVAPLDEALAGEHAFSASVGLRLQLDGADVEALIEEKQKVPTEQPEGKARERDAIIAEDNTIAKSDPVEPEIWLLSSGEMRPFELTLFDREAPDTYVTVVGDELGRVALDKGEDDET